jgi:uncharacterized protein involved in exopolysaccharide biosynthesis
MHDLLCYLPSLTEVRNAWRQHGRKGIIVAGALFTAIAAVTFSLPRTYYSEARLLVKAGWETVALDPTATTGQTLSIYESRESEINSILEVLRSREVTGQVVDLLGVDAILHGGTIPVVSLEAAADSLKPGVNRVALRGANHEQAVQQLEETMQIFAPKKSNVIVLHCEASSPELAQAINNAFIAVYQHVHADANHTKGSYAFFAEQEKVVREKWQQATAALRDAKDRLGVATLDGRRGQLQGQMSGVQEGLLSAQAEIAAAEGKIASLKAKLATTPKFAETSRAANTNSAADAVYYGLQAKEKELSARLTDNHPLLLDVREQLAALESSLDLAGARVQTTTSLNPAWTQLESSLLEEAASLDSLRARVKSLDAQRERLLAELRALNNDEIRLTELQQAADIAEKAHLETAQRLEQARVHRELAAERITNVNVFQPASYVSKAIAPKRSIIMALALFVSILSGAGTIAGLAYFERQFKSVAEIAERLKLPVVGVIPGGILKPALS